MFKVGIMHLLEFCVADVREELAVHYEDLLMECLKDYAVNNLWMKDTAN